MEEKLPLFTYKQLGVINPLLPITQTPSNFTAIVTLLQYSSKVIPFLGFYPKFLISLYSMCVLITSQGGFMGGPSDGV